MARTGVRRLVAAIAALLASPFVSGTPNAAGPRVVDLTPPYLDALSVDSPQARLSRIKSDVLTRAPGLYGPIVSVPDDKALLDFLEFSRAQRDVIAPLASALRAQIPLSGEVLKQRLRGTRPMTVYIAPSIFASNGQVRMSDAGPVVAFGPDVQAYVVNTLLEQKAPYDVRALTTHELFHAQHYAFNEHMAGLANRLFSDNRPALKHNLWIEGLATCESIRLTPGGRLEDALMSRELPRLTTSTVRQLAREFLQRGDSTSLEDHRDYFWLGGVRSDVPKRSGYALGALVAGHVVNRLGVAQAVALYGDQLDAEIAGALSYLASPGYELDWIAACGL